MKPGKNPTNPTNWVRDHLRTWRFFFDARPLRAAEVLQLSFLLCFLVAVVVGGGGGVGVGRIQQRLPPRCAHFFPAAGCASPPSAGLLGGGCRRFRRPRLGSLLWLVACLGAFKCPTRNSGALFFFLIATSRDLRPYIDNDSHLSLVI